MRFARRNNWVQLVKFGAVGASGCIVNLAAYALLLNEAGLQYAAAATGSFLARARALYSSRWTIRSFLPTCFGRQSR